MPSSGRDDTNFTAYFRSAAVHPTRIGLCCAQPDDGERFAMSDGEAGDAYQFEFVSIDGDKLPLA